ncbi:MAG: type secretion protein [Paraburkholderia sp.]|nr:type secretion protein [Paraburkholderia sp.]
MNAMSIRNLLRWPVITGALVAATQAGATDVDWTGSRYVYATNGSSVADALNVFAAAQHVPVRMSGHIEGNVGGRFVMSPQQFLDTLCDSHGLVWYYDGAVLQVSPASEQKHIAIRPNYMSPPDMLAALDHAGVIDAHFPLQIDKAAHTVTVRGPAAYVERIRVAAQRFEQDARERVRTTVRVFRLSIATAADETHMIDERPVTVPGAATLLRERFHHRDAGTEQVVEFDAPLPIIEADARTNSILIRDKPQRIDGDGVLVSDVDVQPKFVSIETTVIDVDASALADLQPASPVPFEAPVSAAAAQPRFGTAVDGGHALLARIDELKKTGHVQLEVAHTALTLAGSPAVIDRHELHLAQEDDDDEGDAPDNPAPDLWLSIDPTISGEQSVPLIGLRIDLGHDADGAWRGGFATSVAPGECLVIAAPLPNDPHGRQRLVLLIPRLSA